MPLIRASAAAPTLLLALLAGAHASATGAPPRMAFDALSSDGSSGTPALTDALATHGLVALTAVPSLGAAKAAVLSHLPGCLAAVESATGNGITQEFSDGTVRRSFAASTAPDGARPIASLQHLEAMGRDEAGPCISFQAHLSEFRAAVDVATEKFAERLSSELGTALPAPLLLSNAAGREDYHDVAAVVAGGEHLEHFHSYQKVEDREGAATIELHTDQGFFIAFTPGLVVSEGSEAMELSDGFYVQDANGEKTRMEFDEQDDLVFMMGDGANQFINSRLADERKKLHAVPHALILPVQEDASQARVWYGRMVLPPNDAYRPGTDATFGQVRHSLVDSSSKRSGAVPGLGCTSPTAAAVLRTSRSLEEHDSGASACAADELFCWFRCQNLEMYNAHECSERSLGVACVNPRGQVLKDGEGHGDYFPMCTNDTHVSNPIEPYPEIEREDPEACTDTAWRAFLLEGEYATAVELTVPDGTKTILRYSIVDGKVKARLAHADVFGWLAIGLANVDDAVRHGMHGGNVLMAKPGGNYSAVTGLDTSLDASVDTHQIHSTMTAFRHWMDPIETDEPTATGVEATECFTALTFESDGINGIKFNLDGTDEMIFAGNSNDYFMGYHGSNRARFTMDWVGGEAKFAGAEEHEGQEHEGEPEHEGHEHEGEHEHETVDAMNGVTNGNINLWAVASVAFAAMLQYGTGMH